MNITIHLRACRSHETETTASVAGDVFTWSGNEFDLSSIPEGGRALPIGDHPFCGEITRQNGVLSFAVEWFYNEESAAASQGAEPPVLTVTGGPVPDPVIRLQTEETEA
ncbi:hypothetical protein [Leisingera sp. M523]|uniref:hypothetical protein n=1 Tax=Leisingera sp. M523 TaxID=2867013 RepID=UPI0021A5D9CA|nr:hypothetical protein [Leisingera sp. M523]UWQ27291.1 hypothetical protein K3557_10645 [Leisingera sp. M523]